MNNLTVLYYSACVEKPEIECKVINTIEKNRGDLPLITVTQKPINWGKNICVGIHEPCYGNEFRQIQIGLREVKTEYVIVAESDVLYPQSYFQFQPTDARCYRYDNVWMVYDLNPNKTIFKAYFKNYSDGAQIVRVKDWMEWIDSKIGSGDNWFTKEDDLGKLSVFHTLKEFTWGGDPVITFKTRMGVSKFTSIKRNVSSKKSLPYWGNITSLKESFV